MDTDALSEHGDDVLNGEPEGVDEPAAAVIESLYGLEKCLVGQMVDLIDGILLRDLHKNLLVAGEADVLRFTIVAQCDLLVAQADQITLTGAGRRIIDRVVVEFSSVEIGVHFAVYPLEEVQVKSFCDPGPVVISGEDGGRGFF